VTSQKSADLIYTAAEAWNHIYYRFFNFFIICCHYFTYYLNKSTFTILFYPR